MGEPTEVDKKLLSLLKGMDLSNYPFDVESTVPCGQLEQLKRCEWLNLKRNGLRQLPDPIPELIELEYLSLAYNKISELDDNFADLSADSLKVLDLRWNRLNNTLASNEHLAHLASLKVLDLSHNAIGLVPSFLEKLKQLTYLSLKATKITAVPPTLFISLTSLTYLDLSDNDLDQMPVQLRRIVGLKTLILNNNPGLISTNLKQIAAFTSLEVLHLKNTGRSLENFPVEIAKCANLYDLDLSENSLPSVPRSLFECGSLKRLNLSDNCIAELPESFDVLIHLETLCISRNELKKIPSGFGKLLNLRSLYMDCNQLTLDGLLNCNLSKMSNLEVFSAAFNLLESIPEALCRCTRLGKLNIMHNKLVNLPESIHFLNLQDLNVNENPNLVMPPKHSGLSEVEAKAALFYNIDFSVEHQLAKARQEQKSERLLSHSSSIDSVSGSGSLPRPRTSSTGAGGGNRKLRIQRRKEEEAGRSDAAKVLSAMRKVAEDAKTADVDNTNQLAADFDEHVSKPLRWDERLGGPVTIDYSNYFEDDIGEVEGVHTWYISNFAPVMLDEEENGRFHQKDCYIVLKNSSNGAEITNTIYFWIGKDAEQDKQTCVAIHAVNLRNCIKATCRTVREDQDEESEEFLSVFVSSFYDFQILEGGHGESGFNHYEQQAANQYLFCLNTTTTHMGMHLVELSPESLDPRYIFMLDIGRALFLWVGNKTPKTKLSKAKLLGEKIIKNERRGRGRVLVVRQGAEPSQFWKGLIVDRPETFTFKPSEWLDLNTIKKPNLYNVHIKQVDGGKYFELSQVEQTSWSLNESQLDPRSVCILDAQTAVFVWEGRKSARILKRASVQMAGVLLRTVIRQDDEAGVIVEKQGFESEFFKSFFSTWTSDKVSVDYTKDNQHLPSSDTTAVGGGEEAGTGGKLKEAKASLSALFASRQPDHNVEDMEYDRLYFFEDLKHAVGFWFNGQNFVKLPENEIGQFYSGDSYVLILYFVHPPDEDEDDESGDSDATDNTATEQDLADDDESASQVDAAPKMNGKSGGLGFASYKHEFRPVFWKGRDASNKAFFNFNLQFSKHELPLYINQQIDKLRTGLNLPDLEASVEPHLVVNQQAEDISLLISFNQQIIVHQGNRSEAVKRIFEGTKEPSLHCVRSNAGSVFIRCIEIECSARMLHSYHCFILGVPFDDNSSSSKGIAYVWSGSESDEFMQNVAREDANKIYGPLNYTVQEVSEGSEPRDLFWEFLGGKQDYETDNSYILNSQLFRCSNLHGFFGVSFKFNDFSQADLTSSDVMILDTGTNVYLWLGENASDTVVRLAYKSAVMYMQYRQRKKPAKLLATKKGFEPWQFKRVFHGWAPWPPPKFLR